MRRLTLPSSPNDKYLSIVIAFLFSLVTWQNTQAAALKNVPIKPVISKNKFTRPINIHNPSQNSQCPKLSIRSLRIKKVDFYNHNYFIYLTGYVKNIGGANFPSVRKIHKVVYRANAIIVKPLLLLVVVNGYSGNVRDFII